MKKGQIQLLQTLSYEQELYTQGLEKVNDGTLLLSAGRYGHSQVGLYDLHHQTYQTKLTFPDTFFAEGLTIVGESFWLLSFQEEIAQRYHLKTF